MKTETKLWIALALFAFSAAAFFLLWANQLENIPAKADPMSAPIHEGATAGMRATASGENVPHPSVNASPRFGWVKDKDHDQVFVLPPGYALPFKLAANKWGYVHYQVTSTEPVNGWIHLCPNDGSVCDTMTDWGSGPCAFSQALQNEDSCLVDRKNSFALLIVHDMRDMQKDSVPAIVGAVPGTRQPIKHLAAQNRVTVSHFVWTCLENCEGLQ